tara:strand:+ start:1666 stop:2091 length:426 start_codon:yes stop_codon:yes gene_type:complete
MIGHTWNEAKGYKVYFNLHKKCFSVLAWSIEKKGWRLCFHTANMICDDVTFKVSESGRQRVLQEKRKNVHAFLLAKIVRPYPTFSDMYESYIIPDIESGVKFNHATYNPYKYDSFMNKDTNEKLTSCTRAILFNKEIVIKN